MQEEVHHARSLGLAVALGSAMGAATGRMGLWVAAGIASYIAISMAGWGMEDEIARSMN